VGYFVWRPHVISGVVRPGGVGLAITENLTGLRWICQV
jgi:hypothetical protein